MAVVIALRCRYLLRENAPYLVDRAPGRELMDKVALTARSVTGILGVHDLKAEYVRPSIIHSGFRIEVARGMPIEEADGIAHEVYEKVSQETGCRHCVVHIDPAGSRAAEG